MTYAQKVHRVEGEGVESLEDGSKKHVTVHELRAGGTDDAGNTQAEDDEAPSGVHCLAMSPRGTHFVTGGEDRTLRVYSHPEGVFEQNVTRFSLPIRACCYSHGGNTIAAAGDDDSIKLIDISDYMVFRDFKAADGFPVVSLAFDPQDELLASVGADGTLHVWDVQSGALKHTERRIAPRVDEDELGEPLGGRNRVAWRGPEGAYLAVPGRDNRGIVVLRRSDFASAFELKGHHSADVSLVSFSPNGMYCATAAFDETVMIWDVAKKEDLARMRLDDAIACGLAWHPEGNALAIIDTTGKYGVWEKPIPEHMSPPTAPLTDADRAKEKELAGLYEFPDDSQGEDAAGAADATAADAEGGAAARVAAAGGRAGAVRAAYDAVMPQPAFQPGQTLADESGNRFLAFNLVGRVIARGGEHANEQTIEVELHDTSRGARVPAFADYHGFTMASLSVKGLALARGRTAGGEDSTIMYRPFTSWGGSSDWNFTLPEEESAVAVAAGNSFVAVATSSGHLRLFSPAGVQRAVLSLAGPAVAMAARGRDVAVAWHSAAPGALGEQRLRVSVFDALEASLLSEAALPVSSGATLSWLGFAEGGALASGDSEGTVRCQLAGGNGAWSPIFAAAQARQAGSERYWVVGLSDAELCCVVLNGVDAPTVHPRPVLSSLDLAPPVVPSDMGAVELERNLLSASARVGVRRAAAAAAADGDEEALGEDSEGNLARAEQDIMDAEREMDSHVLRLLQKCAQVDRLQRALELAAMLNSERALMGAVTLANKMRKPALSERMGLLLEARQAQREREQQAALAAVATPRHAPTQATQGVAPSAYLDDSADREEAPRVTTGRGIFGAAGAIAAPKASAPAAEPSEGDEEGEEEMTDAEEDEDEDEEAATQKALAAAAAAKPKATNPFARKVIADPPGGAKAGGLAAAVKSMQGSGKRKLSTTVLGGRKGSKKAAK